MEKVLPKSTESTDSTIELSVTDSHIVAEQLLAFKRVFPSHVQQDTKIKKLEAKDDSIDNDSIDLDNNKNKVKGIKRKTDSKHKNNRCGRLLPKRAVAILKEWILSPEHFSFPYPTDDEKKILMTKTGINSKQLKYWFINARRRLWKQKLAEQQQLPSAIGPNNAKNTFTTTKSNYNHPHLFIHSSISPGTTITPQQQAAVAAYLHQQVLLRQLAAVNGATFINSRQHHEEPITDNLVNAFHSELLNR